MQNFLWYFLWLVGSVYAHHHWLVAEPEGVGMPGWWTWTKALCLYSQSPRACKPVHRAPTWVTIALKEWNALHIILVPGVWWALCL